jgi:uncharacterized membrane protein YphA (DoxX/SURF4 family)
MNTTTTRWALLAIRGLLTAAFLAAGLSKLAGAEMMVATFDTIGVGQWFRYVTGLIEVVAAILLWVPGLQALAAGALLCTMIGAVIAHLTVLGPSAVPAMVLGVLAAVTLWANRGQMLRT